HPHRLPVVVGAVVGARPYAPCHDIRNCRPQADTLTAAASRKITGEPRRPSRVVDQDWISEVGPMAAGKRRGVQANVTGAAVCRIRHPGVVGGRGPRVVVVDDDGGAVTGPYGTFALCHMRRGFGSGDR